MTFGNFTAEVSKWKFKEVGTSIWLESKPGGCAEIYSDLLYNKKIQDPFLDMNEDQVQWVSKCQWEYETNIEIPRIDNKEKYKLIFEGLDTFATIYFNSEEILKTDNMFLKYSVFVQPKLTNTIRIVFGSALNISKMYEHRHGKLKCWNGDPSRVYIRKAQYQYGWDWGPKLISCGPYRPTYLISYQSHINDFYVHGDVHEDLSIVSGYIETDIETDTQVVISMEVRSPDSIETVLHLKKPVSGSGKFLQEFSILSPKLWYPRGYGSAALYHVTVRLISKTGNIICQVHKHIGFKRIQLIQHPFLEQSGTSFYLQINNIPIFCKGSNWIPAHSIPSSVSKTDYKQWLNSAVNANHNMIRVWGGGYYESDFFYNNCDRLGLLVWQDFMFACGQYPGNLKYFVESVSKEVAYQVQRLRNHCSISMYCGNNEDYQIAEAYNLQWDKKNHTGDYAKTSFPARTIYEKIIPELVAKYHVGIPYHPGSPWGGEKTSDPTVGDIHQWNVWHGTREKYQDWYKLGGRFVSEFGMEALPSYSTFMRCISEISEIYPQSLVVDFHNKAAGFESRLASYMFENIRLRTMDMKSWIYATQLMQAECLGYAIRSWRRNWKGKGKRYMGGILIWQLNDCWPVTSWSLVDNFKTPKLAFYAAKREYRAIAVGVQRQGNELQVWCVNDEGSKENITLSLDIYEVFSGQLIEHYEMYNITLEANSSSEILSNYELPSDGPMVANASIIHKDEVLANYGDWPQPLKYLQFCKRSIKLEVYDGYVVISTTMPIKGIELITENNLFFEDNGMDLFPNKEMTVSCPELKHTDTVTIRHYE
ncbi:hypothetical protein CAAN4_E04984 [[Candida] anglica]|uniref:Beta-mannosidase B n=1 Tax=[Candida] anglica TaxID=148631 RepID=A0ABP0EGR5_9ASCO